MDRIRSSGEAPAVLAGSLAAFPLLDVLALLATTHHVGELKVVREGADDHFWVDAGDLVDPTGGATGRLFDLARAEEAWFTVTATSGTPKVGARMALATVVEHLAPRLAEWQTLRTMVPLDATARMSPSTSRPEVHVRADQWRVLSRLGAGRAVGEVVKESDATPVETLRIVRELVEAGLVTLERPDRAHAGRDRADAPEDGRVREDARLREDGEAREHRAERAERGSRPGGDQPARPTPRSVGRRWQDPDRPGPGEPATRRRMRPPGAPTTPADDRTRSLGAEARADRDRDAGGGDPAAEPPPPGLLMPSPLLTRRWAAPPR